MLFKKFTTSEIRSAACSIVVARAALCIDIECSVHCFMPAGCQYSDTHRQSHAAPTTRSSPQCSATSEVRRMRCPLQLHIDCVCYAAMAHAHLDRQAVLCAAKIIDAYPWLGSSGVIDVLLPKKEQICVGKW